MTLPNRVGYYVQESTPTSGQQVPAELTTHLTPPHQMPLAHFPSPFGVQTDVLRMVERSLGLSPEILLSIEHANAAPSVMMPSRFQPSKTKSPLDSLNVEVQESKNYVQAHKLLPYLVEFVNCAKREGLSPSLEDFAFDSRGNRFDSSLDDFLVSQGINDLSCETEEREEFLAKLEQLTAKYAEEIEKLDRVCQEFEVLTMHLLREQSTMRPVTEHEIQMKLRGIQQKFDYVKRHLKQNVCNAIAALAKQCNKKKMRALPKQSADLLAKWFFENLNDPYPSEEEKASLASAGGLTITQVNNWFGNKRIRYKKKCLSEEAKRSGGNDTGQSSNVSKRKIKGEPWE